MIYFKMDPNYPEITSLSLHKKKLYVFTFYFILQTMSNIKISGLVQERHNSIANALELRFFFFINASI